MTSDQATRQVDPITRRTALENIIRQHERNGWLETAVALTEIQQKRLYREGTSYVRFADYLEEQLDMSRQFGYDHIHAAEVWEKVRPAVHGPISLMFGVELFGLPVEHQIELAQRYESESISRERLRQLVTERKRRIQGDVRGNVGPPDELDALPPTVEIAVADAAHPLDRWAERADLQISSPPYCLGIRDADYVDYDDYDSYLQHLPSWAAGMYRTAAPWGRLALVVAIDISKPRRAPLAADWVKALQDAGFRYQSTLTWREGNISGSVARGSLDSSGSPNALSRCELTLLFSKGLWDIGPIKALRPTWGPSDLSHTEWLDWTDGDWTITGERSKNVGGHPAAFPEELPRRLVKLLSYPGSTVGDLFLGSGTTASVAVELGRHFVGGDISPPWVRYARDRVRAAVSQAEGPLA